MAKKKTMSTDKAGKRQRRSYEERVAALQAQIAQIKHRAAAAEMKKDPALRQSLSLVRAIDKALDAANSAGHDVRHAIAATRKPLAEFLESQGLKLPKARLPRGRKPRSLSA